MVKHVVSFQLQRVAEFVGPAQLHVKSAVRALAEEVVHLAHRRIHLGVSVRVSCGRVRIEHADDHYLVRSGDRAGRKQWGWKDNTEQGQYGEQTAYAIAH